MRGIGATVCFVLVGACCLYGAGVLCGRPLRRGVGMEIFETGSAANLSIGARLRNYGPDKAILVAGEYDTIFSEYPGEENSYLLTIIRIPDKTGAAATPRVELAPGEYREFPGIVSGRQARAIPGREFTLRTRYDDPDSALPEAFFKGRTTSSPRTYRREAGARQ